MRRTVEINSDSSQATEKLAENLGCQLKGGEIIELSGDVGAGKTTFVRGLARGFGSNDRVSSPTFTLSQVYVSGNKMLYHYDFYRLTDQKIIKKELAETALNTNSCAVLEWGEEVLDVITGEYIKIDFKVTGEQTRTLTFLIPEKLTHIEAPAWYSLFEPIIRKPKSASTKIKRR